MAKPSKIKDLQRAQLESRLQQIRKLGALPQPKSWIRTIRQALGMPLNILARRLKVSPPAVTDYEKSEETGSISLTTLQKVAAALECELQILFVPKKPLQEIIKAQAAAAARRIVKRADLQMALEDQKTSPEFQQQQVKALADELERSLGRKLWEQDGPVIQFNNPVGSGDMR